MNSNASTLLRELERIILDAENHPDDHVPGFMSAVIGSTPWGVPVLRLTLLEIKKPRNHSRA